MDTNRPSWVIADNTVVFGPRLVGAWPTARWPRGAQPYRSARARLEPLSSTKTKSADSKAACVSRQSARSASSRSLAVSLFFVRPAQGAAGPVQRGHADGLAGAGLPMPAVVNQAAVGISVQLGR